MATQLSKEAMDLGKEAYQLAMAHGVEFFEQKTAAEQEAEAAFADLHGRRLDFRNLQEGDWPEYEDLRDMAFDSYAMRNPGFKENQAAVRRNQVAVEDRLGKLLATDSPVFILDALGPVPKTSGTTHSWLKDPRPWANGSGMNNPPMTTRQYWERAAGAYASVIAGQFNGDPGLVSQVDPSSLDHSNIFQQASSNVFADVADFVRTTRARVHNTSIADLGR